MKKYWLILIVFLQTSNFTFSQNSTKNIIGLWQENDSVVTSMYRDTYRFELNGKFVFNPNEYDGLNRIISIKGTYKIKKDKLILLPSHMKELIGGYPIRSEITTLSDTWEIQCAKIKTIKLKKRVTQIANLKISQNASSILIDNRTYFKVE